ncbi:MAG: glycosyltransferase family 9 protein [Acetobacteraceae bacterium]
MRRRPAMALSVLQTDAGEDARPDVETLVLDQPEMAVAAETSALHMPEAITDTLQDISLASPDGADAGSSLPDDAGPAADAEAGSEHAVPQGGPAESSPAGSPIRLEIDPHIQGGYILGRFDMTIRGSVICSADLEDVTLQSDGRIISRAIYGHRRSDSERSDEAVRHRFQFSFARPRQQAGDPCTFQIVARTLEGQECVEAFEVSVDTSKPSGPVSIVSGPIGSAPPNANARPAALLYVERAELGDDGALHVDGWGVSMTAVVIIQVYAGDIRVASAKVGLERPDVAGVYGRYPNSRSSGFRLNARLPDLDARPAEVRVEMLCVEGFGQELVVPLDRAASVARPPAEPSPTRPAPARLSPFMSFIPESDYQLSAGTVQFAPQPLMSTLDLGVQATTAPEPNRHIHMFCDDVGLSGDGHLVVSGWAVCAAGIARISVQVDGDTVGVAELGHERPDVGAEHADIPAARFSGFRLERKIADRIDGEHTVEVIAHNTRGDERVEAVTLIIETIAPRPADAPADPPPSEAEQQEFRLELDTPQLVAGAVVEPITGRLTIEGWALARSGIAGISVFLDDQRLGEAHHGLARQDVGAAFPEWPNSVRSGYAFHCPPRSLRDGAHVVRLVVRANNGQETVRSFRMEVRKADDQGDLATIRRRVSRVETDLIADRLERLGCRPVFTVLVRQAGPVEADGLGVTLASVQAQAYGDWRVRILADPPEVAQDVRRLLDQADPDLVYRSSVLSPADSGWHAPLAGAGETPDTLCILLAAGDELGADALAELALTRALHPQSDLIYADEARISPVSREREPFFKPDFSPDLLYSTNYIGRPWTATASLLDASGVTPATLGADGEYDLVLRCAELASSIRHVPKLLCVRGAMDLDDPDTEQAALADAAARRGYDAQILPSPIHGTWRMKRRVGPAGKVSIIIPTCAAHGYIETCITSLRERTAYRNFEIICIDNIPDSELGWKVWLQQNADKVVDIPDAFNWSRFNNKGVEAADGEFLLFLNDDIEIVQDDWLDVLLEHADRPEVGIVGPQLLYPDRKVQHAGMFLTNNGVARHAFRFNAEDEPGYFGLALTQRNVVAVTGACMLVRRSTFDALGRFDEAHEIVNNDLDFCLRAHRAGLLTVFTPYATLLHYELASRDRLKDIYDLTHFNATWGTLFAAGDPYFSPRLSRHADDYRPDDEPIEVVHAGNPLFTPQDIKRILVVKLDHIGDFITGIPSIRRLKALFPAASITVLAGRAAQAFAAVEESIDEFLEFEFFHARSGLGQKELTQDDFLALRERLRPYRFDLAIDLRKQPDTRDVLRYTGARFLAGFEHLGQLPFLDIAVEWEGDQNLHRKRSHVVDDLLSLIETIGKAGRSDRTHITLPDGAIAAALAELPPDARALFDKPVVAIHPGVGTIMRQWPTEHFAAVIDLLVERDGVNAVLIGGPDETELADAVLNAVVNKDAVVSLVGRTPLRHLPGLLSACVLYVGNNSGPKHIAAALGVPTIGIHSGVVDAIEWGPVGKRAVALRRNMACSPCYLARSEDCPRGLACLRSLEPTLVHQAAEVLLARPVPVRPAPRLRSLPTQPADAPASNPAASDDDGGAASEAAPAREADLAATVLVAPAQNVSLSSSRPRSRSRRRQTSGATA